MAICTLVLNVVVAVLLVGYGLWFRNIVNQQLSAKDTTIETLNAAIKLRETEIAGLKGERAPAIAKDYLVMVQHAEQITKEKNELSERIENLTEEQKESKKVRAILGMMAEVDGLAVAADILADAFASRSEKNWVSSVANVLGGDDSKHSPATYSLTPIGDFANAILLASTKLQEEITSRQSTIRNALKIVQYRSK